MSFSALAYFEMMEAEKLAAPQAAGVPLMKPGWGAAPVGPKPAAPIPQLTKDPIPGTRPPTGMHPTVGGKISSALGTLVGGLGGAALGGFVGGVHGLHDMASNPNTMHAVDEINTLGDGASSGAHSAVLNGAVDTGLQGAIGAGVGGFGGAALGQALTRRPQQAAQPKMAGALSTLFKGVIPSALGSAALSGIATDAANSFDGHAHDSAMLGNDLRAAEMGAVLGGGIRMGGNVGRALSAPKASPPPVYPSDENELAKYRAKDDLENEQLSRLHGIEMSRHPKTASFSALEYFATR